MRWSVRAVERWTEIVTHIAIDRPEAAARSAERVLEMTDGLADPPLRGRRVPESKHRAVRELLLGEYRILYRVASGEVEIINVRHGRRHHDPNQLAEPRPTTPTAYGTRVTPPAAPTPPAP